MLNRKAKGMRTLKKVMDALKKDGHWVEKTEVLKMAFVNGKIIPVRTDILNADCVAVKDGVMSIIQVKSNKGDCLSGIKKLKEIPVIKSVRKEVWLWEARTKLPIISIVDE